MLESFLLFSILGIAPCSSLAISIQATTLLALVASSYVGFILCRFHL